MIATDAGELFETQIACPCGSDAFVLRLGKSHVVHEQGYVLITFCSKCKLHHSTFPIKDVSAWMILEGERQALEEEIEK